MGSKPQESSGHGQPEFDRLTRATQLVLLFASAMSRLFHEQAGDDQKATVESAQFSAACADLLSSVRGTNRAKRSFADHLHDFTRLKQLTVHRNVHAAIKLFDAAQRKAQIETSV